MRFHTISVFAVRMSSCLSHLRKVRINSVDVTFHCMISDFHPILPSLPVGASEVAESPVTCPIDSPQVPPKAVPDVPPLPSKLIVFVLAQIFSSYSVGATIGLDCYKRIYEPLLAPSPLPPLHVLTFLILTMPVPHTTVPTTALQQHVTHFHFDKNGL